ncbi:MAG TPA: hypothetical protein PLV92_19410 [Pirellulaceae bacterium]|nr:hypothetical protein [Pirellulaceae bacterium]
MKVASFNRWFRVVGLMLLGCFAASSAVAADKALVPGTGQRVVQVGDDFEDEKWEYYPNLPKSSENIDDSQRLPGGIAKNGRWYEGVMRGTPEIVKRVETPPGGLEGSKGSLLLRSLHTGVPGRPSRQMQQDDFICDVSERLGGSIPVAQQPNCVVRVFLPPVSQWERRSGPHFAYRAAVDTMAWKRENGRREFGREIYYPGMFIEFQTKESTGLKYDTAYIRIRAAENGGDYKGPEITQTGWWTLGMSFPADGRIQFFAKPGIEDLTEKDMIASHYSYGYRCQRFKTFFFNVCNVDDGRTWSSSFIIDDAYLYYSPTIHTAKKN